MKKFFAQLTGIRRKNTRHIFFSLLSKLCRSNATGLDKISAQLLRECADFFAESPSGLTGIFPGESGSLQGLPHCIKVLENAALIPQTIHQFQ